MIESRREFLKLGGAAVAFGAAALTAAEEPALGLIFPPLNYPIPPDAKLLYPAGVQFLGNGVGLPGGMTPQGYDEAIPRVLPAAEELRHHELGGRASRRGLHRVRVGEGDTALRALPPAFASGATALQPVLRATWSASSAPARRARCATSRAVSERKNDADTAAIGIVAGSPSWRSRLQFVEPIAASCSNPRASRCQARKVA